MGDACESGFVVTSNDNENINGARYHQQLRFSSDHRYKMCYMLLHRTTNDD